MNISKKNYILVNLPYIKKDLAHFKKYADLAQKRFEHKFGVEYCRATTDLYNQYNSISLLVGSAKYYKMFQDIFKIIRKYAKTKKPLWLQSWLNIHDENQLLTWHNHGDSLFHGYVSIDPKNTETIFKDYTIKNKIGNVYIGPSANYHKVVCKKKFKDKRITIAFDVIDEKSIKHTYNKYGEVNINSGFIPIY
jgi:hypothetical protein